MKEITENQKKLLSFIKDYTLKHGYQPNVQEMEIYMGVTYKAFWETEIIFCRAVTCPSITF
jgi:SOS-response transcriptional repressor LexA